MYGVPPPAPEPGDIQGRIDAQIDKMYGATAPPPAAAAPAPAPAAPAPAPQASPPVSPPAPRATQAPPARANAPAGPAPAVQGRSKLAQGIIDGHGPAGSHSLTTFVEPGTGKEIITGSSPHGENIYLNLGRTGAGQPAPQTRSAAPAAAPSLKQAIAAAVPLPRPRPDMPGAAPGGTAGPLSTMPGVLDQMQPPKVTGADLDPTPFTQRGDLLGPQAHPSNMAPFMAQDPLAAGIMQPPAATAAAPSLGDSLAGTIMNPGSNPAQTSVVPKNAPPPAWPASGAASVPYAPAPAYVSTFGSEPGVGQTFSGPQSALPWWMQQQMPGFTPQNFGNWGGIGAGGWDGFG